MKDFRPISLSNVTYKIISKVLATRLKPILSDIVSENQTAFTLGRFIIDYVHIVHSIGFSMGQEALC